ncbi:NAD(P)H-dependent oxidoreductase [Psychroserpens burtonensis]|uniref:NAD(P)H-dependent oxidoreductase n=1 Tax=Psychroserpens burtonensis TaxID=49278 RepID=A0A5C7B727_9FLAO|nr:NAD(P)H-dependent oxidoreductase [Psychroserpens burtonensis]TXE17315.1 NAD(P)H-dependent oxidoreductase [Psychroserpens burtonensis]
MKKIITFAGSNSKDSINKQLAVYASTLVKNVEITVLDLNDFELPVYGIDYEKEHGIPDHAHKFLDYINSSDGMIISLAEHNGAYATVFKNLFDWLSRAEAKTFCGKPMLLMATSPGARGGESVLGISSERFPRHDANIIGKFSLPSFNDNFSEGKISNSKLNDQLVEEVKQFQESL